MKNNSRSDIIFWAHGHGETDRFLPVILNLNKMGVRALLFYQDYDFRDGLSDAQQKIIEKFKINTLDYSDFLKHDLSLIFVSLFVKLFKLHPSLKFIYNKCKGLRSKIIELRVDEPFIKKVLQAINPGLSVFDPIEIINYTKYPYGSYYIKKNSKIFSIKNLCIAQGSSSYLYDTVYALDSKILDFDKIYVSNEQYEKKVHKARSLRDDTEVVAYGDPRFDVGWKKEIDGICKDDIKKKITKMGISEKIKILYLCPNLECIKAEDAKYNNLADIARLCKELGNAALLIKPHPRYRHENLIKSTMAKEKLRSFRILDDDPLVCYADYADFIVTFSTSAIYDFLPHHFDKVIVYDNFFAGKGVTNIFKEDFHFFDTYEKLLFFFKEKLNGKNNGNKQEKYETIYSFYRKWVSADMEPDGIARNIAEDIRRELLCLNKGA